MHHYQAFGLAIKQTITASRPVRMYFLTPGRHSQNNLSSCRIAAITLAAAHSWWHIKNDTSLLSFVRPIKYCLRSDNIYKITKIYTDTHYSTNAWTLETLVEQSLLAALWRLCDCHSSHLTRLPKSVGNPRKKSNTTTTHADRVKIHHPWSAHRSYLSARIPLSLALVEEFCVSVFDPINNRSPNCRITPHTRWPFAAQ